MAELRGKGPPPECPWRVHRSTCGFGLARAVGCSRCCGPRVRCCTTAWRRKPRYSSLPRFAEDLDRALDWLVVQVGVDASRLCALGHSVGAAAVLLSASRRHDLHAVVSVSAFAHPEQVMRRWLAARHVPYWPLGWAVNRYVEHVIGARFKDIAPINTLPRVPCPVLLLHGRQDDMVPVRDARQLWQHRARARVTLLECEGTHEGF